MRCTRLCLPTLALVAGCELADVTAAVPEDIVIAEIVLHAGRRHQTAYLHRSLGPRGDARVFDAAISMRSEHGQVIGFTAVDDSVCLRPPPAGPHSDIGTCYATLPSAPAIQPGVRYDVEIALSGGGRMSGSTHVPGSFDIVTPPVAACKLDAGLRQELIWTRSTGASVYIADARLTGLQDALRAAGTPATGTRPIDITALAVGAADTTMTFPGDFGVFDRFDADLHDLLVAIRDGLPVGVRADIALAAADLNYVNWVRGGTFNPSGTVRIPSLHGDGIGVFGSLVLQRRTLHTQPTGDPRCAAS